jgi:hypothetical protein
MPDTPARDANPTSATSPGGSYIRRDVEVGPNQTVRQAAEQAGFISPGNMFTVRDKYDNPVEPASSTLPISIYLDDAAIHEQVEAAVDGLLASAELQIEERDEPVIGSWFRRMRAGAVQRVRSPAGREAALTAAHALDTRVNLAQDAVVTATLLQNLGPVITALQPTRDAVLRVGALLVVKIEWAVQVFQLTAAQQALLDHRPQLASSPKEIIAALALSDLSAVGIPQAAELGPERPQSHAGTSFSCRPNWMICVRTNDPVAHPRQRK